MFEIARVMDKELNLVSAHAQCGGLFINPVSVDKRIGRVTHKKKKNSNTNFIFIAFREPIPAIYEESSTNDEANSMLID